MPLLDQLTSDMKAAMKARDSATLSTVRMLISDLKNIRIDRGRDLDDQEAIAFLSTQAKRRRESIAAYEKAEREDLAQVERTDLAVIERYLPEQLDVDEVRDILRAVIEETGATSMKEMGKVMGAAMPRLRGRFPGGEVKNLVMELLK